MLKSHYYEQYVEAGCDEAGRGCLAGSVYAAAGFVRIVPYAPCAHTRVDTWLFICKCNRKQVLVKSIVGKGGRCLLRPFKLNLIIAV